MRQITRFLRLPTRERWLFLQIICLLPLTGLGVHFFGFNRWYAGLGRWVNGATDHTNVLTPSAATATIRHTIRALQLAVRIGLYGGNCLSRSLTLWWLLRRQGLTCDLRIGARQQAGQFQAHAWVEYQGYTLNETAQVYQMYRVFPQMIVPNDRFFRGSFSQSEPTPQKDLQ